MIERFVGGSILIVFAAVVLAAVCNTEDRTYGDVFLGILLGLVWALIGAAGWMLVS